MLHQIIYTSYSRFNFTESDFFNLLIQSRQCNQNNNITGMLLHHNGIFIQLIEGPKNSVVSLMNAIENDERHYDIEVIADTAIESRNFTDWSMEYKLFAGNELQQMLGFDDIKHNAIAASNVIKFIKLFGNRPVEAANIFAIETISELRITG